MKVCLIKASAGSSFSEYKKMTGGPPQNIFSAAAATPEGIALEMVDETIGMKTTFSSTADIIAIFMSTPDALRAYEIADKFRKKGKVVVLGGLHTAFNQKEALEHADAILIGEVEEIWEQLLEDVQTGNLKKKYQRATPLDLRSLNPYPTDLIPMRKYNSTWSVVVSRGCPFNCAFCLIPQFSGKIRFRPIEHIIEEIKICPAEWIELHSDNLTANREYALELFRALKPLKKKFFGETTILIAQDKELLQAANEAGIKAMLFGIETMSQQALEDQNKKFVQPEEIKQHVKTIQSYGIMVMSDFLFGFDAHDQNIFEDTLKYIKDIRFNEVYPHLLIPFPGSKTYAELDKEGRILTKDWSQYDGTHAVYQPKKMTPKELEDGTYWVWQQSEKIKNNKVDMMIDAAHKTRSNPVPNSPSSHAKPWKSILGLGVILAGLFLDIYWIWGVFFIIWALTDVRNGWTYLLEVVQKNANPVLYWIIVTMWLSMGIWTLFSSPVAYWQKISHVPRIYLKEKIKDPSVLLHNGLSAAFAEDSQDKKNIPPATEPASSEEYLVRSDKYGIAVTVPQEWKVTRKSDADSETIEISAPDDRAYLTVLCVDMQTRFPISEFVSYMQDQLQQEMPFVDPKQRKQISAAQAIAIPGSTSEVFEYLGKYNNYKVKTLARYIVQDTLGYVVLGTYEHTDQDIEKLIQLAVDSIMTNTLEEKTNAQ